MSKISAKFTAAVTAAVLSCSFTGCSQGRLSSAPEKIDVICTTFSEYDWTRQIVGDSKNVEITYLLGTGVDLHNYQPSAEDIMKISDCDMFVYVGGESDKWVDDALSEARNKDMQVVKLLDSIGDFAKEEEIKEGMEAEEEEEEEGEEEGPEYDEHVWLSLRNAEICCDDICNALCKLDSSGAEGYKANLAAYNAELDALDSEYTDMANNAKVKTIVFGDRFPFRYLVDDYGIDYYAAFVGCSAETEASFETIVGLANKIDELGIDTVFTIENSDSSIAQAVIDNSQNKDRSIETLNSIQSVTADTVSSGVTYISIMRQNLETLRKVLD
ncbi:MAG TPA: metal ABC transporter substrate-binding protein [Ruminococcus flavefaciens]|nr:metal ABC transporter substrate-binding protein [Ruminococcus flavefaciens]HQM02705.1 metal ABC transporter substrate-binding protein [Ruminococcus flavefaciens]